jgi:hypothetical protein
MNSIITNIINYFFPTTSEFVQLNRAYERACHTLIASCLLAGFIAYSTFFLWAWAVLASPLAVLAIKASLKLVKTTHQRIPGNRIRDKKETRVKRVHSRY